MNPNILFIFMDNLGYGEVGCYGGGLLRGAPTPNIDSLAREGTKLLNLNVEPQCTPSRSCVMTGRHSIRSGTHSVPLTGGPYGLVQWEETIAKVLSKKGYATGHFGKWGPPHSYDEALWEQDPWYLPGRDPVAHILEATKGQAPQSKELLACDVKVHLDVEYTRRAVDFIKSNAAQETPFLLYYNHTLMHIPVIPRNEFRGTGGNGDWADCLLQLDADFGELLDTLTAAGTADNTIVVFAGDNGNEEALLHRGTGGYWEGSYFTGMEASLRTPCIARWPGHIPGVRDSNEIMYVTDWFTTLLSMAGLAVPDDRIIDGKDQTAFLSGEQETSNRDGSSTGTASGCTE